MTTALAESERRRAKVERMRGQGTDPFPDFKAEDRSLVAAVIERHDPRELCPGPHREHQYRLAGRIVSRRKSGAATLLELRDRSGTIPVCVHDSETLDGGPLVAILECDIGDVVSVTGHIYVSSRGKLALEADAGALLTKALKLFPEARRGVKPTVGSSEVKLLASAEHRRRFTIRARMLAALREWMDGRDFIEVETPILQIAAGGAQARPFSTHHRALDCEMSLRVSAELYMRRCTVGDLERVYELGKRFRNEGISRRHNPEFTMLEWSMAFGDYSDAADYMEQLISHITLRALGTSEITYRGTPINLARPWRRMTLREAIEDSTGIDIYSAREEDLAAALPAGAAADCTWADAVQRIYGQCVEPHLSQPTIVFDFPLATHPCMKEHASRPELAQSFDIVIGGVEVGSGGTAITDPAEQSLRFVQQNGQQDGQEHANDREFIGALQYGAPPSAGAGIGIERLLMVLLDTDSIRDVMLFPIAR